MIRTIYWYLHFTLSLLFTFPCFFKLNRLQKKDPNAALAYANVVARKWALGQAKASGSRFTIKGQENLPEERPVLFVSNHQSNFDTAIFLAFIPLDKGYIAKKELLKIPILRDWMHAIQCVFLDRGDIKKSAQAILDGIRLLKSGYSMVVYPEGTRSRGGPLGEFKAGSFKLATKTGVPIVPVTIDGSYKIMEANNNKIKPGDVTVIIHPPVFTKDLTKEEMTALPERVKAVIQSVL